MESKSHPAAHATTSATKNISGVPPLLFSVRQHPFWETYTPKAVVTTASWHAANATAEARIRRRRCSMVTTFFMAEKTKEECEL